jgi:GDP-fucose transporter C1
MTTLQVRVEEKAAEFAYKDERLLSPRVKDRILKGKSFDTTAANPSITIHTTPPKTDSSSTNQWKTIALVVLFYYVTSISLVFLNKIILQEHTLPYPIFVTWVQVVISVCCIYVLSKLKHIFSWLRIVPNLEFKPQVALRILPLTLVFICMVALNNLCLQYVQVSFYQVARSLTILFSIFFTFLLLGQSTSMKCIHACLLVVVGFSLGSIGEAQFSWLGIFYGVLSSLFVALYGIVVKRVIGYVDNDNWRLLVYNSLMSSVLMLPMIHLGGELDGILNHLNTIDMPTALTIFATGIFGFLINIAVFLQIKHTSPLTNNMSGTFKGCFQIILSSYFYGDEVTFLNGVGSVIVIIGTAWYSHTRYLEMKSPDSVPHSPQIWKHFLLRLQAGMHRKRV